MDRRTASAHAAECGEVARLMGEVDRVRHALLLAREEEEAAEANVDGLSQSEAAAAAAVDPTRADRERVRECLERTATEVEAIQEELARLASGGRAATVQAATAPAGSTPVRIVRGGATAEEELGALGRKELDEIRSFPKPPLPVRHALELVQALFAICPGADAPPGSAAAAHLDRSGKNTREESGKPSATAGRRPEDKGERESAAAAAAEPTQHSAPGGSSWCDVQALLQRHDFIPRLLQLRPHDLAADPPLLYALSTQWPAVARPPLPQGERQAANVAKALRRGGNDRERALGRERAQGVVRGPTVGISRSNSALPAAAARGPAVSVLTEDQVLLRASRPGTASAVASASPLSRQPRRRAATDLDPSSRQQTGMSGQAPRGVASHRFLPKRASADGSGVATAGVTSRNSGLATGARMSKGGGLVHERDNNQEAVARSVSELGAGMRSEGVIGGQGVRGLIGRSASTLGSQTLASPLNRMETARTAAAAVTWAAAESEAAAAEAQASTPVLAEAGALSASGDRLMRAGEYGAAPPAILGLTIEAVEFASQPCGTLFRWCGAMLRSALALLRAREELTCRLATQSKRLHGLQSEAAAVSTFSDSLERDYAEVRSCREVAEGRRAAARAVRVRTELALNDAMTQLAAARGEAARAVAAAAEAEAAAAREAAEREERRVARGVARKEAQARAAAAVEKALAEQREAAQVAVADKAAWVHTETLAPVRPIEFGPHGSDLGPETKLVVHTLVRALLAKPELRLHIAGHSAEDEEPKLSSSRAQAVGAALIAAGAPPNRLRAKGYGSTVPLTPPQRARLRLRSERRVTVHAIAAVRTTVPLCFDECSAELGTQMGWVVEGVVALLREQPHLRLSVEGHADPTEGRRIPRGEGNQILPGGEREVPVAAPPDTPADSTQGRRMPPGAKLEVPAAAPPGAVLVARGSALWGDSKRRETNSTKGRKERAASAARGNVASNTDGGEAVSIVESPAGGSGDDTPWVHALALQRSIAVRDALMAAGGVMASRLVHHAFGDSLPVVADSMREEGRAANRRVELLIIPDVAIAERGGLA